MQINNLKIQGTASGDAQNKAKDPSKLFVVFDIAYSDYRPSKDPENSDGYKETRWFNVICSEKIAEDALNLVKKGQSYVVEGRLTFREYQGTMYLGIYAYSIGLAPGEKKVSPNVPPPLEDDEIPF